LRCFWLFRVFDDPGFPTSVNVRKVAAPLQGWVHTIALQLPNLSNLYGLIAVEDSTGRCAISAVRFTTTFLRRSMSDFLLGEGASLRTDLLSGLTVALALVPEAVAFAFVAGV